jgi:hypothetical protein
VMKNRKLNLSKNHLSRPYNIFYLRLIAPKSNYY